MLFVLVRDRVLELRPNVSIPTPRYQDYRPGDVRHTLADISKAKELPGFRPKLLFETACRRRQDGMFKSRGKAPEHVLFYEDETACKPVLNVPLLK